MRGAGLGAALAATSLVAVAASACGSGTAAHAAGHPVKGGTATISLVQGAIPNYIFPFTPPQYAAYPNPQGFQELMWRPLYWVGDGNNPGIDYAESLASQPVWSDGNRTATLHLKPYRWSDGHWLSPANVAFWMGLDFTEKAAFSGYTPGYFPDNVASVSYDDAADTVTFNLTGPVSPTWFTDNQLTQIMPLPLNWDLTGAGRPGQCASESTAAQDKSCPAVYKYLTAQSQDLSTYASNPLWQVVDGPWRLTSFSSDGHVTMVPDKTYSGPVRPSVSELQMLPYTSETSVYNALRSGSTLTVGNVPVADAPQADAHGLPSSDPLAPSYTLVPLYQPSVDYGFLNYQNAALSPLFSQLYFRQALQSTVDQSLYIDKALRGYGIPTYGPVPLYPSTSYISPAEKTNPYPFSISAARQYLTSHGWTISGSGPATCTRAGTGAADCGAGIKAGMRMVIPLVYPTDSSQASVITQQWQSDAARAGIELDARSVAYNALLGIIGGCGPHGGSGCDWGIANVIGNLQNGAYPSGENLLAAGAGQNFGHYNDPVMNQLIKQATTSPSTASLYAFEDYAAKQVPYPWMPVPAWSVDAVATNLGGATPFNVAGLLMPENWYFVK